MKKYLLPEEGNFYKAAMHVHTNISDGRFSPEDVRDEHIRQGYQVVAFTDHEVFVPHNEFTNENFVALNSTEISVNHKDMDTLGWGFAPTYHLNMIAKDKNMTYTRVCTDESIYVEHSHQYMTEEMMKNDLKKEHNTESVNNLIKVANEDGFLVCYNHPKGNRHTYPDYCGLKGLWGVECFNGGITSRENDGPFEDLLNLGNDVFPLVGDDSHFQKNIGACFTMIKAKELTYESIIASLEKGDFYSSSGPEIKELYIEDGVLNIKTSPIAYLMVITDRRASANAVAENFTKGIDKEFKPLTDVKIDLNGIEQKNHISDEYYNKSYFRIVAVDERGFSAYTKAYRFKDFF